MITLHSLAYSRAVRVAWLLEELELPYEVVSYARTEEYRAPAAMREIHPLGKSPILVEGDLVLTESAAILRYLEARHGTGSFAPQPGSTAAALHEERLDYVEGSLARWVSAGFWAARQGEALEGRPREELGRHLDYLTGMVEQGPYLMGDALTLADIQLSYLLAMLDHSGLLESHPAVEAYWRRLRDEPGLQRAVAATGPIMPAA